MSQRLFVELDGNLRHRLEAVVDMLIDLLDQLDGDPDLEDDDAEEVA
ncbi:hypothetical protein [Methylocystis sp. ATCC 49242]|nr:hypothetical protein [Methylocystis sp. ATCC 49242]